MSWKLLFYERYGVLEYYIDDPDRINLGGFIRGDDGTLVEIADLQGWVSPRLGIRFEVVEGNLVIYRPDGERFLTPVELCDRVEQERERAEQERADSAEVRTQQLAARLREMGVDPEGI